MIPPVRPGQAPLRIGRSNIIMPVPRPGRADMVPDGMVRHGDDIEREEIYCGLDKRVPSCFPEWRRVTDEDVRNRNNSCMTNPFSSYEAGTVFLVASCGHSGRPGSLNKLLQTSSTPVCPICREQ